MKLTIESWFSGENTSVKGEIDGHTIDATGDASSRGCHATIDGQDFWWYGGYGEDDDDQPRWAGEIEEKIDDLFEATWNKCKDQGVDPELNWKAEIDGEQTKITQIDDE